MRADRLLRILFLLQGRRKVTAGELGRELEVSTRTIQRDMTALSTAGIPVYATRGGTGGWALLDNYRAGFTGLTTAEALAIIVAQPRGILGDLGLDDPGESLVHKFLAAVAPSARQQAEHARQRIHVDLGRWDLVEENHPSLPDLHRAAWEDRIVHVLYGRSESSFPIAPLGLVRKGTSWYLVACRNDDLRTYRVSRLRAVEVTEERFERPPDFDLAAHWREMCTRYAETFPTYLVTLRARGEALIQAGWIHAREKSVSSPDRDGWADVVLDLEDEEHAFAAVQGLGGDIVVVAPESLRRRTMDAARRFLELNDGQTLTGSGVFTTSARGEL
ncbi:helix-turn-helix transcriptional regulator [Actinopolymorpha alba]|uniref:helix-turn-helix transcriptional regulator n=1 Tax=Actinopolymorpha alba TaxID=533267 RepID=UPI0007C6A6EE|nr:WYL domain-containing protein [Actinopolymorpha alba]